MKSINELYNLNSSYNSWEILSFDVFSIYGVDFDFKKTILSMPINSENFKENTIKSLENFENKKKQEQKNKDLILKQKEKLLEIFDKIPNDKDFFSLLWNTLKGYSFGLFFLNNYQNKPGENNFFPRWVIFKNQDLEYFSASYCNKKDGEDVREKVSNYIENVNSKKEKDTLFKDLMYVFLGEKNEYVAEKFLGKYLISNAYSESEMYDCYRAKKINIIDFELLINFIVANQYSLEEAKERKKSIDSLVSIEEDIVKDFFVDNKKLSKVIKVK